MSPVRAGAGRPHATSAQQLLCDIHFMLYSDRHRGKVTGKCSPIITAHRMMVSACTGRVSKAGLVQLLLGDRSPNPTY